MSRGKRFLLEVSFYTLLAILIVLATSYLYRADPITYASLVLEDHWGEFATGVAFGLCGLLSTLLFLRAGKIRDKAALLLIALGALFVAGEEFSWGQRILDVDTPQFIKEYNKQGELTLHNLYIFNSGGLQKLTIVIMGCWMLLSLAVAIASLRPRDSTQNTGFPLIPVRLFPLFLLTPYAWRFGWRGLRMDELGELCLGLAMFAWALDRFLKQRWTKHARGTPTAGLVGGALVLLMAISWILPELPFLDTRNSWGLNHLAAHSYAELKMYDQSRTIYEYINSNPHYIRRDTRIRHGRLLIQCGEPNKASQILRGAAAVLDGEDPQEWQRADYWLRRGVIHVLLGEWEVADEALAKSNTSYRTSPALHHDAEKDARITWWTARTLLAGGDKATAIAVAASAREKATSFKLQAQIDQWIECAQVQSYFDTWEYYNWIEFTTLFLE